MKSEYFIFTSDWHLRHTAPVCRTDDFYTTMLRKVRFVFETASYYDAPIIIAGDLGHCSQWSNNLLYDFITLKREFPDVKVIATLGQHDLTHHKLERWQYSGVGILNTVGMINVPHDYEKIKGVEFYFYSFGKEICPIKKVEGLKAVAITHQMVIQQQLWTGQKAKTGRRLLKEFPEYDVIVCGDNHLPFIERDNDRILINCGSLMRTTQDQREHKPRIYLWDSVKNKVEEIYLPIKKDVFRKDFEVSLKDENMELFIKTIKGQGGYNREFSFKENLRKFLGENVDSLTVETVKKINKAIALES